MHFTNNGLCLYIHVAGLESRSRKEANDRQRKSQCIDEEQGADRAPVSSHAAVNGEARGSPRDEAAKYDGVDDEVCLTWQHGQKPNPFTRAAAERNRRIALRSRSARPIRLLANQGVHRTDVET